MKPPADDSIAQMYAAHSRALLLYARQWLEAAAAEDVVQRVFVRLLASGRIPAEPRTWLFRCVRNEAISASRADRRRNRREQSVATGAASWFIARPEDRIDAAAAQDALLELPAIQREIVTLRLWSGLTLAEISAVTDIATSSVHHHYRTAIETMRQRLEASCRNRNR